MPLGQQGPSLEMEVLGPSFWGRRFGPALRLLCDPGYGLLWESVSPRQLGEDVGT